MKRYEVVIDDSYNAADGRTIDAQTPVEIEADSVEEAIAIAKEEYGDRIFEADTVEIGEVEEAEVWSFSIVPATDGYEATYQPMENSTYVGYGTTAAKAIIEVLWLAGELGNVERPVLPD